MSTPLISGEVTQLQKMIAQKAIKMPNENNPVVLHKLSADPAVLVYKDTVYLYATNDSQQAEFTLGKEDNAYTKINTFNVFCSKDLVNWTDCGEIPVAGKNNPQGAAKWANNSWAPAICTKNIGGVDKFFLYFADSANGIGVLTAESPLGPFTDPLGHSLISRSSPGSKGVHWLFDPAVIVDDDGKGYLYYGGGVQDDIAHPKSARCVQLGDDFISIVGTPCEIDAPWLFEDSGINKFGNTYYYTYCANWSDRTGATGDVPPTAVIAYMTSDKPLGPFTYRGYTLENPGKYFGPWGNNHHWIFEFKGKKYIAYHAQTTEKIMGFEKGGYRSLYITDFKLNDDGSFPIQTATKSGVEQVCNFNVSEKIPAATMHSSINVAITNNQTVTPVKDGGYLNIKNADLRGAREFEVLANSGKKGGKITVRANNVGSGNLIAEIEIPGGKQKISVKAPISENFEICPIYLILSGDVELIEWTMKIK